MAFLLPSHFLLFVRRTDHHRQKTGPRFSAVKSADSNSRRVTFASAPVANLMGGHPVSLCAARPFHQLRFALPFRRLLTISLFSPVFFVATYKIATGHTKSNQSTHMAPVTKTTVNRLLAAYPFPCGFGFALPLSSGGGFPIPTNQQVNLLHTFPFNSNQITGTSHLNF